MSKIYDVIDIVGENQFTYQLYTNVKPTIEDSSDLNVILEASPNITLFASFDVSGIPPTNADSSGVSFYSNDILLISAAFRQGNPGFPYQCTINSYASSGNTGAGFYEIYVEADGRSAKLYYNGVWVDSHTIPIQALADSYIVSPQEGTMEYTNIVLGT